jgi:hypothetical protein
MGYNTTVIVLSDALHLIAEDKEFGRKLYQAICGLSLGNDPKTGKPYRSPDISAGNYVNAATAIESHHASSNAIIAVGGNCATVLGYEHGDRHDSPQDKERILRSLAAELGFTLRKKKV